jgi:GNAT superfamily N-acetyltransferase
MRLRTAQPRDAAAVAGVHVRSWQAAYRGLLPDEYLDGLRPDDRAQRYTFGERQADRPGTIVATTWGEIRGFATIGPCQDEERRLTGEVLALYVDPEFWGRGIGRVLMLEARTRLARQGYREAVLWVLVGNDRAERFYRVDGWTPDGSRRYDQVWGVTVDEIRFRKSLR